MTSLVQRGEGVQGRRPTHPQACGHLSVSCPTWVAGVPLMGRWHAGPGGGRAGRRSAEPGRKDEPAPRGGGGSGWAGPGCDPPPALWHRRLRPAAPTGNFAMEFAGALGLVLALALAPEPAGGHPEPCGVLARLGALLPRAPAARARARAALARAVLTPRLPHNLSLELVAVSPTARDPASLARGLCQALAAPGVAAVLAFPEARPELLQLHFLAAAAETPVLSVLRREARAPLGAPVRTEARESGRAGTAVG